MAFKQEILDRAKNGPQVSEESFNLDCVYATLCELIKKYDISYDPDNPVPADDALADRIYQAAIDFFVECGIYYKDTRSVIKFTRSEVLDAVAGYDGD